MSIWLDTYTEVNMWFFQKWSTVSKKLVTITHVSPIMGGLEWTTDEVLLLQKSNKGNKRAFLVSGDGQRAINYDYITHIIK